MEGTRSRGLSSGRIYMGHVARNLRQRSGCEWIGRRMERGGEGVPGYPSVNSVGAVLTPHRSSVYFAIYLAWENNFTIQRLI